MPIALYALILLIGLMPVFMLIDGTAIWTLILIISGAILTITVWSPHEYSSESIERQLRPWRAVALMPLVWMLMQMAPLPLNWANPIYAIAVPTTGAGWGHLTIDVGATMEAFGRLLLALTIGLTVFVLAANRRNAELVLFALTATTTFIVTEMIVDAHLGRSLLDGVAEPGLSLRIAAAGTIGLILNITVGLRALERRGSRRAHPSIKTVSMIVGACVVAGVACAAALASLPARGWLPAVYGGVTIILVVLIRRLRLTLWPALVLVAVAIVADLIAFQLLLGHSRDSLLVAATDVPSSALAPLETLFGNATWAGSGAGTFTTLRQIYVPRPEDIVAPSTALIGLVEWGNAVFAIHLIALLALTAYLFRAALRRGRDWLFPTAAAACCGAMGVEIFCDASLLEPVIMLTTAAVIGMGLAQSVGLSAQH